MIKPGLPKELVTVGADGRVRLLAVRILPIVVIMDMDGMIYMNPCARLSAIDAKRIVDVR